jgi:cytochrome P450
LRANPIDAFSEQAYEAGIMDITRGRNRVVLVNEPAAIERILVDNAQAYAKSEQQQRRLRPALGGGLLTAEGAEWRSARRVAAPLFSPRAIEALGSDMAVAADAMVARWRDRADEAAPLDLSAEFQRLTYEIVSRTVFSGALDDDRVRLHAHMAIYFDTIGRIDMASVLGLPKWWPSLSAIKARPSIAVFRGVVNRVVGAREAEDREQAVDLLDRLMRAPDPQSGRTLATQAVADNVLTFLSAGHETTGNALAWILYLLSLFPDVERRVRDELSGLTSATVGRKDMEKLVFTRAVVDEAMRLYPPAPFIGRVALEPDELAGEPIGKGTEIVISPWIAHRRRATWEDPDRFRPERFMPGAGEKARGAFIPFGLGPRICIGQGFALQEIVIVLSRVLPAFRFTLAAPEKVFPLARITLQPDGGMWMRARRA